MNNSNQGFRYRNRRNCTFSGRTSLVTTIISGIAGVVIKDLTNENSRIKGLLRHVFKPRQLEKESEKQMIEADYSIIEEKESLNKEIKDEK